MDNLQESVYTFHHVGSRDQTRVLWHRCPLSHLAGFCTSCFDKNMIRPSVYLLIDLLIPFTFSRFFSNSGYCSSITGIASVHLSRSIVCLFTLSITARAVQKLFHGITLASRCFCLLGIGIRKLLPVLVSPLAVSEVGVLPYRFRFFFLSWFLSAVRQMALGNWRAACEELKLEPRLQLVQKSLGISHS